MMKICEGLSIAIIMYITGCIRQYTGSYFGVSILIIFNSGVSIAFAFYLMHLADTPQTYKEINPKLQQK